MRAAGGGRKGPWIWEEGVKDKLEVEARGLREAGVGRRGRGTRGIREDGESGAEVLAVGGHEGLALDAG